MESSRLSARLAAYLDAIQSARKAGVTWAQLGHAFGTNGKYMAAAAKVAASGKYLAQEQLPLPLPSIQATQAELGPQREQQRRVSGWARKIGQESSQQQESKPEKDATEFDFEACRIDKNR